MDEFDKRPRDLLAGEGRREPYSLPRELRRRGVRGGEEEGGVKGLSYDFKIYTHTCQKSKATNRFMYHSFMR